MPPLPPRPWHVQPQHQPPRRQQHRSPQAAARREVAAALVEPMAAAAALQAGCQAFVQASGGLQEGKGGGRGTVKGLSEQDGTGPLASRLS